MHVPLPKQIMGLPPSSSLRPYTDRAGQLVPMSAHRWPSFHKNANQAITGAKSLHARRRVSRLCAPLAPDVSRAPDRDSFGEI